MSDPGGRLCASCGASLEKMSRRARFCGSTCRANASRRRARGLDEPLPGPLLRPLPGQVLAAVGALIDAPPVTRGTPLAELCLSLAATVDHTGSPRELAAVTKELRAALAQLTEQAANGHQGDIVDELRARHLGNLARQAARS